MNKLSVCVPRGNDTENTGVSVFLAGTIDLGNSVDWQSAVINRLSDEEHLATVFNPRRIVFEENEDEIAFQIQWELKRIHRADLVFFNIIGSSKSPVTLLELGLCLANMNHPGGVGQGFVIIVCPPDFYRYQNVKETCDFYRVTVHHTFEEGYEELADAILDIGTD